MNDRTNRRTFLLSAAAIASAASRLSAQETTTFSTSVKVVNLLAAVRNKKGEFIRDLTKDDFALSENGRPQAIQYFARQSDLPLTIGLMVDTSMSQRRVLEAERGASFRFLDQVLREGKDQVFIMQFDWVVQVRQDLTSSFQKLNDALSYVDTPDRAQLAHQTGGGTLLYDAVVNASRNIMKNQTGRKALIVLSDGVDFGSDTTLGDAIEEAQRADTLIYSVLFSDDSFYGMFGGGREGAGVLMRMSKDTGAGYFEVSKKRSIDQIFNFIQEELRSQYSIGYVSDQPVRIPEFRKIQLTTNQKGLIVQARDRYWARR